MNKFGLTNIRNKGSLIRPFIKGIPQVRHGKFFVYVKYFPRENPKSLAFG